MSSSPSPTSIPQNVSLAIFIFPSRPTQIMDVIQLTGIRCYGYTGYLEEERFLGQWFEVDLRIHLDLTAAGQSDRIEDTLDYRGAIATVKQIISTARFALVEKLADTIVTKVLAEDRVQQVELKLHKLAAPIPDFGGKITIELTRSRG
jgi:7,8-dihydroneopterin aldolase/epimerase/oxygenase